MLEYLVQNYTLGTMYYKKNLNFLVDVHTYTYNNIYIWMLFDSPQYFFIFW